MVEVGTISRVGTDGVEIAVAQGATTGCCVHVPLSAEDASGFRVGERVVRFLNERMVAEDTLSGTMRFQYYDRLVRESEMNDEDRARLGALLEQERRDKEAEDAHQKLMKEIHPSGED